MGRSLGLPLLLVSLVVGGILFAMQMKSEGPASAAVTQAETQAVVAASSANFQAADAAMTAWLAEHGSYAGATLDPSYMVTVARADATTYCLQTTAGGNVEHEAGPGGTAVPGPC
jgi:lipid-binding SYLF domain-containing protein